MRLRRRMGVIAWDFHGDGVSPLTVPNAAGIIAPANRQEFFVIWKELPLFITYLVIMAGAALGGAARFCAGTVINEHFSGRFPLATFLINVTGSFGIGLLMTLLTERFAPHPYWRFFLVVGFLGGYTTFSSFEWEALFAARNGSGWIALSYVLASVVAGFLAVWLGALVARRS